MMFLIDKLSLVGSEEDQELIDSKKARQINNAVLARTGIVDDVLPACLGGFMPKRDAAGSAPPFRAAYYVVSEFQMEENGYPRAKVSNDGSSIQLPEGFVRTESVTGSNHLEMVAVDCEMCYTAAGLELTRVSLVNIDGKWFDLRFFLIVW